MSYSLVVVGIFCMCRRDIFLLTLNLIYLLYYGFNDHTAMEKIDYSNDMLVEDVVNKLHLKEWEEIYEITYSYKKIATGWINQSFFVTVWWLEETSINTETIKNAY